MFDGDPFVVFFGRRKRWEGGGFLPVSRVLKLSCRRSRVAHSVLDLREVTPILMDKYTKIGQRWSVEFDVGKGTQDGRGTRLDGCMRQISACDA